MNIYDDDPAPLRKGPVLLNVWFEKAWKWRINTSKMTADVAIVVLRRAGFEACLSLSLSSHVIHISELLFFICEIRTGVLMPGDRTAPWLDA